MPPRLNEKKQMLLNQVSKQPTIDINKLVDLVKYYEDLSPNDFQGYISDVLLVQLRNALRDPNEIAFWNDIVSHPSDTVSDLEEVLRMLSAYMQTYPNAANISEARSLKEQVQERIPILRGAEKEESDWSRLERGNYYALQTYKSKYPASVHLEELDDLMWANTKAFMADHSLRRYLTDWPVGRHAAEANAALQEMPLWEAVSRSRDLFQVDDYRDNHPNSPFKSEVDSLYYKLRDEELQKMKAAPWEYEKEDVQRLIDADIFKSWELIDEGLMTDESWDKLCSIDREMFPDLRQYCSENPNVAAAPNCTDVYLFGTPGTGKTCLLMGLSGAHGAGYTLNMKSYGGEYAAALQEYVLAGITPGRTFGSFVTTINGHVNETDRRGNIISHDINLVEMSGEEFALRIADAREVSLANMGTGATALMANDNRKVFFIIVDCSKDTIKVEYEENVKDASGEIVSQRVRKKYISQLSILNKFVSLFELPENQQIMDKVDAIHFIVTKADTLGEPSVRIQKAIELLQDRYSGPVSALKNYCRKTKRINYSNTQSPYSPKVFTFSLGRFYLGDVFDFDKTETLQIIKTIQYVTGGTREKTWWDKVKDALA